MSKQRVSRKEMRRQQVAREKRMRLLRVWLPVGLIAGGIIIFSIIRLAFPQEVDGVAMAASAPANQHDSELQIGFGGLPPMGGPHNPAWQNCGIYDTPVAGEYAIHSMEHGAVWLTYHPDLPAAQVAQLADLARGDSYILMNPYPDQDAEIVLTVWDRQLVADGVEDGRIQEFIDLYRRARGPESAARCDGGVGVPTG